MLKKIITVSLSIVILCILGGCETNKPQTENSSTADSETTDKNSLSIKENLDTDRNSDSSVLVAYFSWSGNTKQLALEIQAQTGGDLFEIIPENPYTDDINELSGIALREQSDNIRPALSVNVEDIDKYDTIFIGFPNWWNDMPMPVFTFLEEYDFSGKTIIPFTTYGNGGWGKSLNSIKDVLTESTILDGIAIQEHELESAEQEVTELLLELGI